MRVRKKKVEEVLKQGLENPQSKDYENVLKQLSEEELRKLIEKLKERLGGRYGNH